MVFQDKIRQFIEKQFLVEFDETFPESTDLFREGVMDSFGYVQLHRFLEREFGIAFSEADLTKNLLVSCTDFCVYVLRKMADRGVAESAGEPARLAG